MIFGVANSIFASNRYDPISTITYSKDNNFAVAQIYINDEIKTNENIQNQIKDTLKEFNLSLIIHFPNNVSSLQEDTILMEATGNLLCNFDTKNTVLHLENKEYTFWEKLISFLNKKGFTPLLENFYTKKTELEIQEEQNLLHALRNNKELKFNFLFDIPRLYHCNSHSQILNIEYYEDRYFSLFFDDQATYFHIIDSVSHVQKRDDWCSVGKGIIPYRKIIDKINKCYNPVIIFEFENTDFLIQSRDFFLEHGIIRN